MFSTDSPSETAFSGVVRVDVDGHTLVAKAHGLANRAHGVPNVVDTRFGLASGTKGLTALAVMALVEHGVWAHDHGTTRRSYAAKSYLAMPPLVE